MQIRRHMVFTALLLAAGAMELAAEVPRDQPYTKYRNLWQDSPFTAKPVTETGPAYNPLSNYVLLGISPIANGHRVTLLNKRQPTSPRIYIETGKVVEGLRIKEVVAHPEDPMATVVIMMSGSSEGSVSFDEKFLKLPPPAAPSPKPAANQTGQPQPAGQPAASPPRRPARAPVVQPPSNNNQSQSRFQRGR